MKPPLAFLTVMLLTVADWGFAQGFVNLDFESANIPSSTPAGSLIPISEGLPGWSACFVSTTAKNQTTQVAYEGISLGGVSVSIVDAKVGLGFYPIQGNYSAFLCGGVGTDSQLYSAQISQTGVVPSGTESVQFDAVLLVGPPFIVTLGGQTITMSPLETFSAYSLYGGNIPSSLAGEVATLAITEPPPTGVPPSLLELDDIVFSPASVPEPGTWVLVVCGAGALALARRRSARRG